MPPKSIKSKRNSAPKGNKPTVTGSTRADTLFPVGRLNSYLKKGRYAERCGSSAGAFMAAVLEYITGEILELAGDITHDEKKKTIMPRHINLGIRSDSELQKLMANTVIFEGGHQVKINTFLLPEKKQK